MGCESVTQKAPEDVPACTTPQRSRLRESLFPGKGFCLIAAVVRSGRDRSTNLQIARGQG
eukprot:scaffold462_cov195-Pinguiococcus_pyrenoidosus.AAC.41